MVRQKLGRKTQESLQFALLLWLGSLITACSIFSGRPAGELELTSGLDVCLDLPRISMETQIALLPVENLSDTKSDLIGFYQQFRGHLVKHRVRVLNDTSLQQFMRNNRVRYSGGLSAVAAQALLDETGAELFLITSVAAYNETVPPKIAFLARLVTAGADSRIIWMDSVALSGNDAPGLLGLGEVKEIDVLAKRAFEQMTRSLVSFIEGVGPYSGKPDKVKTAPQCQTVSPMTLFKHASAQLRYAPKSYYRSPIFDSDAHYTVALVQPLNNSERNQAGYLLMLHLLNQLVRNEHFTVVEPGLVREQFLNYRLIMESGVSLSTSDVIFGMSPVKLDLVMSGIVFDYQDDLGIPKVDFSLVVVEKNSREVVWDSKSYNEGNDWVFLFDVGEVHSANELAQRMVKSVVNQMTH